MDLSTVLMPGAQNLATAMLTDAWVAMRGAIARRWGRGDASAEQHMETQLDAVRTDGLALIGMPATADSPGEAAGAQQQVLAAYCAGYLRGLLEQRSDLVEALALPSAPGSQPVEGGTSVRSRVSQVVHGDVHAAISVDRLEGGINLTNSL